MNATRLPRSTLSALAFGAGYLALWFVWGVPWPWLPPLALAGALAWAWAEGGGAAGLRGFVRAALGCTLAGLTLWWVGAVVAFGTMTLSPHNPLPVGPIGIAVPALGSAGILWLLWQAWKLSSGTVRGSPLAPWLWLAGMLTLFTLPPVRIDCRGLMETDSFLYADFSGWQNMGGWSSDLAAIGGREEWPADFEAEYLGAYAARCTRPFTFAPSQPLVLLQANEVGAGGRNYAAAFLPITHKQLTPWVIMRGGIDYSDVHTAVTPQLWPRLNLKQVFPVLEELPPELEAELGGR